MIKIKLSKKSIVQTINLGKKADNIRRDRGTLIKAVVSLSNSVHGNKMKKTNQNNKNRKNRKSVASRKRKRKLISRLTNSQRQCKVMLKTTISLRTRKFRLLRKHNSLFSRISHNLRNNNNNNIQCNVLCNSLLVSMVRLFHVSTLVKLSHCRMVNMAWSKSSN